LADFVRCCFRGSPLRSSGQERSAAEYGEHFKPGLIGRAAPLGCDPRSEGPAGSVYVYIVETGCPLADDSR